MKSLGKDFQNIRLIAIKQFNYYMEDKNDRFKRLWIYRLL